MGRGDGTNLSASVELVTHRFPALCGESFLHEGNACRFGMNRDGGEEHAVIEARVGVTHFQVDYAADAG